MKTLCIDSIVEMFETFKTEEDCRKFYEESIWPNGQRYCPHCNCNHTYKYKDGKTYKCSSCKKQFSLTKGSIFERTHYPLLTWFRAIYLLFSDSKGISSYGLAKKLKIPQSNACYLIQRIRIMAGNDPDKKKKMTAIAAIELDEVYLGGVNKNRRLGKRRKGTQGRSKDKVCVFGMKQRGGKVFLFRICSFLKEGMQLIIKSKIEAGATVCTDELGAYDGLSEHFVHGTCNHGLNEYVRGKFHTNSIESVWASMKRSIKGIYHSFLRKYVYLFCKEVEFRHNSKNMSVGEKLTTLLSQSRGISTTLKTLRANSF